MTYKTDDVEKLMALAFDATYHLDDMAVFQENRAASRLSDEIVEHLKKMDDGITIRGG